MTFKSKKTAIAAAALFAVCAVPAYAADFMAGGTTMSVYGVLDGSVYTLNASGGGSSWGWASNNTATSRLGFAPTRDLGNGLKVGGQLEQELEFATGGSGDGVAVNQQNNIGTTANGGGTFNRAANVFISGTSWGELRLGRQIAPSLAIAAGGDVFGYNSGGYLNQWVYSSLLNGVLMTGKGGQWNINPNASAAGLDLFNSGLLYVTPAMGGFQAKLFTTIGSNYQPITGGGGAGNAFNYGGITDMSLSFNNGPLSLTLGQLSASNDPGTPGSNLTTTYTGNALTATQFTASYKMNATKLNFAYGTQTFNSDYQNLTGADNIRVISFGVTQNLNEKTRLGASYTQTDDTTASVTNAKTLSLLAEYNLDSNTAIYTEFSSTQDNAADFSGVYGSTLPAVTSGGSVTSLMAGVRLKF